MKNEDALPSLAWLSSSVASAQSLLVTTSGTLAIAARFSECLRVLATRPRQRRSRCLRKILTSCSSQEMFILACVMSRQLFLLGQKHVRVAELTVG